MKVYVVLDFRNGPQFSIVGIFDEDHREEAYVYVQMKNAEHNKTAKPYEINRYDVDEFELNPELS